jgi:hypothetical protein
MAATYTAAQLDDAPRTRLRQLDAVLGDLEELNLNDVSTLPVSVGSVLISLGIDHPYAGTITDLIDLVFEEQAKVMTEIRAVPRFAPRRSLLGLQPAGRLAGFIPKPAVTDRTPIPESI